MVGQLAIPAGPGSIPGDGGTFGGGGGGDAGLARIRGAPGEPLSLEENPKRGNKKLHRLITFISSNNASTILYSSVYVLQSSFANCYSLMQ